MSGWIDIKFAVPSDERKVLLLYYYSFKEKRYEKKITIGWRQVYKNGKVKWRCYTYTGTSILYIENQRKDQGHVLTHWMPLPEITNEQVD